MFRALGDRRLLAYLAGNLVSIVGTWGQRIVLIWLAWDMTRSTAVIGLLAALDLAPSIIVAPFAGSLVDRRPARLLARNLQLVSVLPSLALAALLFADVVTLPALMGLALVIGILNGMDHPIRLALVGGVVARRDVASAVALNSIAFNIGRMIGPVLGGLAVSSDRLVWMVLANAASFVLFAGVLSVLRLEAERRGSEASDAPPTGLAGWTAIIGALGASGRWLFLYFAAIAFLLRPVFELLPAFARNFVAAGQGEAVIFATLTSAQAAGALAGAGLTAIILARLRHATLALSAGAFAAASASLFAFAEAYGLAIAALGALSGAILANGISTQVMLQTQLPEAIRGRALSLYTVTFRGMPAFGTLLFGLAADRVEERDLVLAGAAVIAIGSVWLLATIRNK